MKIPTAEEFFKNEYEREEIDFIQAKPNHVVWMMQEFAKLHVKAALEAAANKIEPYMPEEGAGKSLLEEVYSESNIK